MAIETWADLGALPKEELESYTPEDYEALKASIEENEGKLAETRAKEAEAYVKAKELAENYKVRAEKAEKARKDGVETSKTSTGELDAKDIIAIAKAEIPDEDYDEVLNYAKYRNLKPAEALKDKTLKTILSDRAEERRSAQVANTKPSRVASTANAESLLAQAAEGKLPENDADIEKLVAAEMARKTTKGR